MTTDKDSTTFKISLSWTSLTASEGLKISRKPPTPRRSPNGGSAEFQSVSRSYESKYNIEQIAAKTGKSPAYIAQRVKLTELVPVAVYAFYSDEIGVGHALLLAKLPTDKQEEALISCFQEEWSASRDRKAKRILLPARTLQSWIEQNILLLLKGAPFDKREAHLVAIAGSCVDVRSGQDTISSCFPTSEKDACTDPSCYQVKVGAHVAKLFMRSRSVSRSARPMASNRKAARSCAQPVHRHSRRETEDEGRSQAARIQGV
jgi:ParB family chromosome partitioning protein